MKEEDKQDCIMLAKWTLILILIVVLLGFASMYSLK